MYIHSIACYSYISDITTKQNRTRRLAYLDGLFPIGFFTGMFLSGTIKEKLGMEAPFAFGIGGAILCVLYTYFFIEDSRKMRPIEVQNELEKQNVNILYENKLLIF